MDVKNVFLVRHGQSRDNVRPVYQSTESPLDQDGQLQAEKIAQRVSKLTFETLIASPMLRARQTAEKIEEITKTPIEFSDLFIERKKPTQIDGKSYQDKVATRLWESWEESLYRDDLQVEDGENYSGLVERADRALEFLEGRPESCLVVVTHGFFLRTLICRVILGDELKPELFERFQKGTATANTGLSVLQYGDFYEKNQWRLWIHNDHAHLG